MSIFAWLRKRPSADPAALADFLARQAAFAAQKTVYDYVRVKAGRDENRLFNDPDFQNALRHCRWQVWFGAAADVVLLTEAWLRPAAPGREAALGAALLGLHARLHDTVEGLPPTEAEASRATSYFSETASVREAARDLLWALLNTKEFLVNH